MNRQKKTVLKAKGNYLLLWTYLKGFLSWDQEEMGKREKIWRDLHGTRIALLFHVTGKAVLGDHGTALGSMEQWVKPGWKWCKGLICPQIQVHFLTMPWAQTVPTHPLVLAAPPVLITNGRTVVCESVFWAGWGSDLPKKITWHNWKIFFQLHRLCNPLQCCGNISKGDWRPWQAGGHGNILVWYCHQEPSHKCHWNSGKASTTFFTGSSTETVNFF